MPLDSPDHYETLGLDRDCSLADVRAAYRRLAKQHHPDRNHDAADAVQRTQELNAAYETLSHPARRRAYDAATSDFRPAPTGRPAPVRRALTLSITELLRGLTMQVKVSEPGSEGEEEPYELRIPSETAPGTILRVRRNAASGGGWLLVRIKARPSGRFKVRGSDLRTDLRIPMALARTGGREILRDPTGEARTIQIPPRVRRGTVISVKGAGLPKKHGGRGDMQVRILYRPEVRFQRLAK